MICIKVTLIVVSLLAPRLTQAQDLNPFWGCGLLGKDIEPTQAVWQDLITALQKTNHFQRVVTWNWDIQPQNDEHLSPDFLFFPNVQCGGTNADAGAAYLMQNTALPGGAAMGTLALGGNEPDQVGYCQNYTDPSTTSFLCDAFKMRAGQCTGASECYCKWDAAAGICRYDVTGCGMWPVSTSNPAGCAGQPFPFWCFGKGKKICGPGDDPSECCSTTCNAGVLNAFTDFYKMMADKGYTYATTPIVASDLTFIQQLMQQAGCSNAAIKELKGRDRLKRGCPTHSAFHFYTTGCPKDPDSAIEGFKQRVQTAKALNAQFALAGTISNELGSLKGPDATCTDGEIATMMGKLFDHLMTDGKGVVSQMTWFNEKEVGGTFDLRLIKDGKLSALGEKYKTVCQTWAQVNGFGDKAREEIV